MTPHQDTSTEREALKPCPFCGKTHTAEITTAQELAEQDSDYDGEFWQHSDSFAVICNASRPNGPGGCGASGGFFATKAEAIAAWNRRAALASRDEASQQPQGQAVSDGQIIHCFQEDEDDHTDASAVHIGRRAILALRDGPTIKDSLTVERVPLSEDWATIAGLESAVYHLSTLVDQQRALLAESEDVFGRDGHGGRYEDGECGLIDRIRAHLEMTAPPPKGITAKEQGNGN